MFRREVVVTGLGIISPVGCSVDQAWRNVVEGVSGVAQIPYFDVSGLPSRIAGVVQGFDPSAYFSEREARRMDVFVRYGLAAGIQAYQDSGVDITRIDPARVGVCVGSGIGGLPMIEQMHSALKQGGPRKVSPFFVPGAIVNMVSGQLSVKLGLKGSSYAIVTACATGTHCIANAAKLIESGASDIMLAGGAEAAVSPLGLAGFSALRALSTRNDDPGAASCPWDEARDGFVLGEGAGVLVLEEYEHAKARGAHIYCRLLGSGMSADAHHITAPEPEGLGAAACMQNAVEDAGIAPQDVIYVNAHGTSTALGDVAETSALRRFFGNHADKLWVSSTKSMTGHLLGAAGGVEAIFSVLSLANRVVPPTINLHRAGEGCDLDYVPLVARDNLPKGAVLSNSFGFGGTNGTLVFSGL